MQTDILIITGLKDELDALLHGIQGGRSGWIDKRDVAGYPFDVASIRACDNTQVSIAAAWAGSVAQTRFSIHSGCISA